MEFIFEVIFRIIGYGLLNAIGTGLRYLFTKKGKTIRDIWEDDESNVIVAVSFLILVTGVVIYACFII